MFVNMLFLSQSRPFQEIGLVTLFFQVIFHNFKLICTVFEIIDGATLDDGKVLESGSHQYVVTCAVSFEFKPGD